MTIGGINGNTNAGAGAAGMGNPDTDSYSKNLKKQIADAQKELQALSRDDEMDPETKRKKRQEIQKQINDLNMQLRQHQMDERRKAQQEKQQNNQQRNQPQKSEEKASGLSKNGMEAMLSAEGAMKLAKVQGSTANQMQNEADIKRTEIRLEGGGSARTAGDNAVVSKKWDEVEGKEQKAQTAAASQASLLTEAQSKLDEANGESRAKSESEEKSGEKAETEAEERPTELGGNIDIRL